MEEYFAVIEDPRHQGYVKHRLCDILTIVMCAVLCGFDKLCDIMIFAEAKESFLRNTFGITEIPSKPTFSRVLAAVDGQKVAEAIISFMKDCLGTEGDVVAVDGKAIRSTSKDGEPHSALQIVTAYLTSNGLILGQEKIHDKTNEIPVLQEMLEYLNIKGKVITADAMHCQRETCNLIKEKGGDYLICLKGNQGTLHEDIDYYFNAKDTKDKVEVASTSEKNNGRGEHRICRKLPAIDWVQKRHDWPWLKSVFSVERIATTANGESRETRYFISSVDASAEELLNISRSHWQIESLHWSLDCVFSEDEYRLATENAHICLNAFRKYALGMHKNFISANNKKYSIKGHMRLCSMSEKELLKMISWLLSA